MGGITDTLFGGGESKQRSSSRLDPRIREEFLTNLEQAREVADNLEQRRIAPTGQLFDQGTNFLRGAAGNQAVSQASGLARSNAGFSPSQVQGSTIDAREVSPGRFNAQNVQRFLNPATDQVVDRALQDIERSRQLAQQRVGDRAVAAGAFGGSRQGIVEAETNRGFADTAADTAAQLRQQAFDRATALQQAEFDRGLTAQRSNQQAGLAAGQANQQTALEAGRLNQQAGLQGQGLNLQAIGLLGDLGQSQQDVALRSGQALANLGLTNRQLDQLALDSERELELQRQQIRNEALGIAPAGGAARVTTQRGNTDRSSGIFPGGLGQGVGTGLLLSSFF